MTATLPFALPVLSMLQCGLETFDFPKYIISLMDKPGDAMTAARGT